MKKVKLRNVYFSIAVVMAFLVCGVKAQDNRSSVSGFVFDSQRMPQADMVVELLNDVNSSLGRMRTDGSGRYYFSRLSSGRFNLRVQTAGTNFEDQTVSFEISGIGISGRSLADHVQKDIYLNLKKDKNGARTNEVVFAQDVPDEARKLFKKAVSDFEGKRVDLAIDGLNKAIEIHPTFYLALEKLGMIQLGEGKYEDAQKNLKRAVSIYDRSYDSWYGLGYASYALTLPKEAVECAEKAVSINADSIDALVLLGVSFRQDKQYEKAEKPLKQASKLANESNPDIHWNLALLYAHNLDRYKDAAEQLELYLKAAPEIENKETIKKLIKQFREKASKTN